MDAPSKTHISMICETFCGAWLFLPFVKLYVFQFGNVATKVIR